MQVRIKDINGTGYIDTGGSGPDDGLILAGTIGTVLTLWQTAGGAHIRVVFPGWASMVPRDVQWAGTPDQVIPA